MAGITFYITYNDRSPYDTLNNVTSIDKDNEDEMYDGRTFRNIWTFQGNLMDDTATVPVGPAMLGLGVATPMDFVDTDNVPASIDTGTDNIVILPDNVKHVAPRFLNRKETYIVFTIDPAVAGTWGIRIAESKIRSIVNVVPPSVV